MAHQHDERDGLCPFSLVEVEIGRRMLNITLTITHIIVATVESKQRMNHGPQRLTRNENDECIAPDERQVICHPLS